MKCWDKLQQMTKNQAVQLFDCVELVQSPAGWWTDWSRNRLYAGHSRTTHPKPRTFPPSCHGFMLKLLQLWILFTSSSSSELNFSIVVILCLCVLNLTDQLFFTGSGWSLSWTSWWAFTTCIHLNQNEESVVFTFLQPNVDSVLALCAEKFWILGELLWNDPAVSCCPGKADLSELQIYLV